MQHARRSEQQLTWLGRHDGTVSRCRTVSNRTAVGSNSACCAVRCEPICAQSLGRSFVCGCQQREQLLCAPAAAGARACAAARARASLSSFLRSVCASAASPRAWPARSPSRSRSASTCAAGRPRYASDFAGSRTARRREQSSQIASSKTTPSSRQYDDMFKRNRPRLQGHSRRSAASRNAHVVGAHAHAHALPRPLHSRTAHSKAPQTASAALASGSAAAPWNAPHGRAPAPLIQGAPTPPDPGREHLIGREPDHKLRRAARGHRAAGLGRSRACSSFARASVISAS